jgi:hypothetical protein
MGNQPSFQFYHDDYVGGTIGYTMEQHGAYLMCLISQYKNGHQSKEKFNRVCNGMFDSIAEKFCVDSSGDYYNARMDEISIADRAYRKSRAINRDEKCQMCANKKDVINMCLSCDNHMLFICSSYDNHMGGGGGDILILNTEEKKNTPMSEPKQKKSFDENGKPFEFAKRFDTALAKTLKTYKNKTPLQLQSWAHDFDMINRADHHSWEDIEKMIRGVLKDEFWRTNILSPSKLRERWASGQLNRCFEGSKDVSVDQPAQQTKESRYESVTRNMRLIMPHATDDELTAAVEEYLNDNKN